MFDTITDVKITIEIGDALEAQMKHTLKQVIEWGNEICPHYSSDVRQPKIHLHYKQDILKKECEECWAELTKEVEK